MPVQPDLCGSNDLRIGRKIATFQLFFQSGQAKNLSAFVFRCVCMCLGSSTVNICPTTTTTAVSIVFDVVCYCYYIYIYVYHLYPGYLQFNTWHKTCFCSMRCYGCSVFTVCATCNVILYMKYVLYCYINTLQSSCVVPNVVVVCSSLKSCFPSMLLRYWLSDFEMVPIAPVHTGITFFTTFHMHWISVIRTLYFRILSTSFLITFLSPDIATSINIHVPFSLSRIMMSILLLGLVLSVGTCWFHI